MANSVLTVFNSDCSFAIVTRLRVHLLMHVRLKTICDYSVAANLSPHPISLVLGWLSSVMSKYLTQGIKNQAKHHTLSYSN